MKLEMTWTRNENGTAGFSASWKAKPETQEAAQADELHTDAAAASTVVPWLPKFRQAKQAATAA